MVRFEESVQIVGVKESVQMVRSRFRWLIFRQCGVGSGARFSDSLAV